MERGRGRGKKEKRNRSRSPIGIGGKRRETTIDSDKDMQDSCNTSFEDVEEHESADISSKTIPSNTELTVNSGHISEKEIVASQNITEQPSVVKVNNSNKPGKAYIIDTTKSNQQNAEIFYNIEDRLINKSEIDSDSLTLLLKNKLIRYEESTIGECKITCKLTADKITVSKGKNYLKILAWFNNNKIFPLKINIIKYNLAEAIFSNCNEANLCLDTMDRAQTNDKSIIGFINNKSKFWRGVITDWPYDIPQLWQEIINKDEVTKMERMFRRIWNKEEKVMMNKKTDNIIITMKGSQLKENITIFENLQYKLKWDLYTTNSVFVYAIYTSAGITIVQLQYEIMFLSIVGLFNLKEDCENCNDDNYTDESSR
ncbi:uncharacterized protein LOC115237305 isoform X2 [Formica exsecta]|uniref:uncharacterized protein LOC115237305 isoform X2 n=1 Tax=Formica exsecta TaxID=72781 RepID=UPI0011422213|nr:uncharacterized protein LOC115237305 isoform X2 [Formica exsecta]